MRVILVAGSTRTAAIDGISAAGADPDAMAHTPSADAEVVCYGDVVRAPTVPVSPSGCPTPALFTRVVRELVGVPVTVVDGGLLEPTGAPTVTVGARPGGDVREADPVPTAPGSFAAAREFGRALPDGEVVLAETIPGGTTTALGVARGLGEPIPVSSSLPYNPLERKREVVAAALDAADAAPGDFEGRPLAAARHLGDPVLPVVAGIAAGALDRDARVVLGGGTQLATAAAMVRHRGIEGPLTLATTSVLAEDVDLEPHLERLDVDLTVTDPDLGALEGPIGRRFAAGEGKEGAGMGGALWLAERAGVPTAELHERLRLRYEDVCGAGDGP